MSHTLHRRGNRKALEHDYILFMMTSKKYTRGPGFRDKMHHFEEICARHNPVNMGDAENGNIITNGIEGLLAKPAPPGFQALFDNEKDFTEALQEVVDYDCGISVVFSGLFDRLFECCKKTGIEHPNCLAQSLGVIGATETMPDPLLVDMTTMCGHGQVSVGMIRSYVIRIKRGEMTINEAATELARPCNCGVFNITRAERLLEEYCTQVVVFDK